MDAAAEVDGTVVVVKNGTTNAGTLWITASNVTTLETDPIEFININAPFTPSLGTANQLFGMDAAGAVSEWKTLSGTSNQITVTHGVGAVTFATPQNIATTSAPTFADMTLTGATPTLTIVPTSGNPNITIQNATATSQVQITSTGAVPIIYVKGGSTPSSTATAQPRIEFGPQNTNPYSSGNILGSVSFHGYAGTDYEGAMIGAYADASWGGSNRASNLQFWVSQGSSAPVELVRVNSSGETQFRKGGGIRIYDSDNTNYVAIVPPSTGSLTGNYTLTLPTTDGTSGYLLTTDGSGVLSWTDPSTLTTDTLYTADGSIAEHRTVTIDSGARSLYIVSDNCDFFIDNDTLQMNGGNTSFSLVDSGSVVSMSAGTGGEINISSGGDMTISADDTLTISSDQLVLDVAISSGTGDIYYRETTGFTARLPIGSAGEVLTVTGGKPAWEAAPSGSPAGVNYNLQYYNSGAFGADSNITVTPGAQMKLAVGTSTPAATLHARNHNSAGSATILAENSSGNDILKVLSSGYTQWGDNESLPRIYQTTSTGSSVSYTGGGLTVEGFVTAGASYDVFGITHTAISDGSDGPFVVQKIQGTHAPSSGAGDYVSLKIAPTINQTGTHTGDGYGIQVAPTLTAIGDKYVAYLAAVDNADAYGFAQEGDASLNYFDGFTGFGTTTPSAPLEVEGDAKVTHLVGNSGVPSYTLGSSSIVGSGAALTLVGHDTGFEATLTTGTGVSSIGTIFTITFAEAFTTNAPVVTFSARDLNSALEGPTVKPYVNSTSTTNFTFNNITALTSSTTYKWSFTVVGK